MNNLFITYYLLLQVKRFDEKENNIEENIFDII